MRPDALQFHHIDRATKVANIQAAIAGKLRGDKVWIEIAKCEVLCANCHQVEHAEQSRADAARALGLFDAP